jgi:hypothetical protein
VYDGGAGINFSVQLGNTLAYLPAWTGLALTLMYSQCITDGDGSYGGTEITKFPMQLALTLMYGQCTTNAVGSYDETEITKLPM